MISRNLIFYVLYSVKMSVFYVQFYLIPYSSLLFISLFFIFYLLLLQVRLSFAYFPEFSLSSKVDSYDVKVGSLVTECCRHYFRLSFSLFTLFPRKVDGSNLQVASFLADCRHLMRTLFSTSCTSTSCILRNQKTEGLLLLA